VRRAHNTHAGCRRRDRLQVGQHLVGQHEIAEPPPSSQQFENLLASARRVREQVRVRVQHRVGVVQQQ
jgi:hypothetical protein